MRYLPAVLVLLVVLPASAQTVQDTSSVKATIAATYSSCRSAAIYPTNESVSKCKDDGERMSSAVEAASTVPYDCSSVSTYTGGMTRCNDIIEATLMAVQVIKAKTGQ